MSSQCLDLAYDVFKPYSAFAGGIIFGSGWWIFGDALAYRLAVLHLPFNPLWLLPGLVATIACIVMNTVSRDDVSSGTYGDEAATVSAQFTEVNTWIWWWPVMLFSCYSRWAESVRAHPFATP